MLCLRFRGKLYNVNLLCYNIVRKYTIGKDLDLPGDYRLVIFDQLKFNTIKLSILITKFN